MRSVFLDRDGTINRDVQHLRCVEDLELLVGASEGIRMLNRAGLRVVVITNQAAIARGLLSEEKLAEIHQELQALLAREGAFVDAIYYCPHHPTEGFGRYRQSCSCRKPQSGSLQRAANELGLDLSQSYCVGDKESDLEAGHALGCRTILVRTGYGLATEAQLGADSVKPDYVASNLLEAAGWILDHNP
ncbi:MAG TPA: HAD family hydrolase [Candidatus Krumholzibacteria bacterium]|nr:HAD family hydrolase [Candidatus Krumholzibacteria bacterium]